LIVVYEDVFDRSATVRMARNFAAGSNALTVLPNTRKNKTPARLCGRFVFENLTLSPF